METRFQTSRADALTTQPIHVLTNTGIEGAPAVEPVYIFDACHVGVVLRAVLAVQTVIAVAAMFTAPNVESWFRLNAFITGGALPATVFWLLACCALKRVLHRLSRTGHWVAGMGLGALAGLIGCALLAYVGSVQPSPWFASAIAGALLACALVAVLMWQAQQRAPASDAARLAELQSRIRPHFLFNTLNTAIALVRDEPAKAELLLEDLSELFRSALVDQGEAVTLEQEIELAQRYLAIEQVRFGSRLRVKWMIDPESLSARLPPLLLQPLIENAVQHGVEPSSDGAEISIHSQKRGSSVVIKIINTTPGGQGTAGHGLAQSNVQERLRLLHDVQASFRTSWDGGVYQVRLEVPL